MLSDVERRNNLMLTRLTPVAPLVVRRRSIFWWTRRKSKKIITKNCSYNFYQEFVTC